MQAVTVSTLRTNLASTLDAVINDKEEVVITRDGGSVVIIDLDEYESLKETAYLLRSTENGRRLNAAIESIEQGEAKEQDLSAYGL